MGGFIYGWAYIWNGESVSKLVLVNCVEPVLLFNLHLCEC